MKWQMVSLESRPKQPWRNGGGTTQELFTWPFAQSWTVRMSVALIDRAGPFSQFDGIDRWFAVLDGAGVVLRVGEKTRRLTTGSPPFGFPGHVSLECEPIDGPSRDFNLMAKPGRAELRRVGERCAFRAQPQGIVAVYAHAAPARVHWEGESIGIAPLHLAWALAQAPVEGTVEGIDALCMELLP